MANFLPTISTITSFFYTSYYLIFRLTNNLKNKYFFNFFGRVMTTLDQFNPLNIFNGKS